MSQGFGARRKTAFNLGSDKVKAPSLLIKKTADLASSPVKLMRHLRREQMQDQIIKPRNI
jgi:hypothetical protein